MPKSAIVLIFLFALVYESCTDRIVPSYAVSFDPLTSSDTLLFDLNKSDSVDINLILTHDIEYAYENIYFWVKSTFTGQVLPEEKIISVELMDQYGSWKGRCSGSSCTISEPLFYSVFPGSSSQIRLVQYSRFDTLHGIRAIDLILLPAKNGNL